MGVREFFTIMSLLGTVCLAIWTMRIKYHQEALAAQRKYRLELVNAQLANLYGPLLVVGSAGKQTYISLLKKLGIDKLDPNNMKKEQIEEWIHWMKNVLQPLNERREKIVLENCHLISGGDLPNSFALLSVHVQSYKVLIARWDAGDSRDLYTHVDYPAALDGEVEMEFNRLKKTQAKLIEELGDDQEDEVALLGRPTC